MQQVRIDRVDAAILNALQRDATLTNADLAAQVHLSPSQCSRRRAALEAGGLIKGYGALLDADALGFGMRAITRVNLRSHGQEQEAAFAAFLARQEEVRAAHSVSGDADYVLDIRVPDLAAFARFVHEKLLPQPQLTQVRSEIVLKTLKDEAGVTVSATGS